MGDKTNIAWCDKTFNPWVGCTKVSLACDNCYAEKWAKRSGSVTWGGDRRRTSKANWKQPLRWDKEAKEKGIRYKVFCASLADVFDNQVPDRWRMDLFELIANTTHIDWLILTKRIGNVQKMSTYDGIMFDVIMDKVWLGITVCNQSEVIRDVPKLLEIPSKHKFLSIEPMLGPIELERHLGTYFNHYTNAFQQRKTEECCNGIDWVIVGGETGINARPMFPAWVEWIKNQCLMTKTAFFFKQWGEYLSPSQDLNNSINPKIHEEEAIDSLRLGKVVTYRVGKKKAGHLLDGQEYYQFPK